MTRQIVQFVRHRQHPGRDVGFALGELAQHLSTRSVRLAPMILIQAIPNAMVTDLAVRNVAGQLRKTREAKAEPLGYQGLYRWDD